MAVRATDHPGHVRVLTLDRPPANAIDASLLRDLLEALGAARDDDAVRAVVLTGAGRFFSGGFDFRAPARGSDEQRDMQTLYRDSHAALLGLPKPTVALVNGHATAGGFVLAVACDARFGVDGDWKCGLNEIAVGAGFPRAATEIVRARLSAAVAAELMLGGRLYPASEAIRLGLVDRLLPPDATEEAALAHARHLATYSQASYAHTKASLLGDALARIAAETAEEALEAGAVWTDPESREARRRQREKLGIVSDD